jgi:hypothetical protein
MEELPRQSLLKTVLLRPISTVPTSTRSTRSNLPLTLSIRKITPMTKRIPLCELKFMETGNQTITLGRKIRQNKYQDTSKDNEESPSLLVSDEAVKEYLRTSESLQNKTQFLKRLSRLTQKPKNKELEEKTMKKSVKYLKREFSQAESRKKHQRMFDLNDIFSIANGKLKFKK